MTVQQIGHVFFQTGQVSIQNEVTPQTADELLSFTGDNAHLLAELVKTHTEHKEDFYEKVRTENGFSRFSGGNAHALAKLVETFPAHSVASQIVLSGSNNTSSS